MRKRMNGKITPGLLWLNLQFLDESIMHDCCRYDATDMNVFRSALSACVVKGLSNVRDFILNNREAPKHDRHRNTGQNGQSNSR